MYKNRSENRTEGRQQYMVQRVPIKVKRTPIQLTATQKPQIKLWELMEITRDEDIVAISQHYDMLRIEASNQSGFTSLPLDYPEEGKNWIHFESVYEICRIQGWEPKFYLEAVFDHYSKSDGKFKYPLVNMLYSVRALRAFVEYKGDVHAKYKKDVGGEKKKKGRKTATLQEQITNGIEKSTDKIASAFEYKKDELTKENKALYIFNNWYNLSPFYLYSVLWFHEVLEGLTTKQAEPYKREFKRINKSLSMRTTIDETTRQMEEAKGIPRNIVFK